ncbi:MAG: hypothetical protein AAF601_07650 [Pseudomonadota bacterium]
MASLLFQAVGLVAIAAPFVLPLVRFKSLLGPVVLVFLALQI